MGSTLAAMEYRFATLVKMTEKRRTTEVSVEMRGAQCTPHRFLVRVLERAVSRRVSLSSNADAELESLGAPRNDVD
jgi:hypothetical protein